MILTSPLLKLVYHRRLGFDTVYLHAKFDDSSFCRSIEISLGRQNLRWITWP